MKIRVCFIALILFSLVLAGTAKAGSVLFVSPTRVVLDKKNRVAVVNISNQSDIHRTYNIKIEDLMMTEAGVTKPMKKGFDYSLKKYLRYTPRRASLAPGERQALRIMIRPGADLKDGAYHSHLRFVEDIKAKTPEEKKVGGKEEKSKGANIDIRMSYSAAIPVVYSHGNVNVEFGMKNAKLIKDKEGKLKIKLDVTRSGNGQGRTYTKVFYKAAGSSKEVALSEFTTQTLYREVDLVHREYDLKTPEGVSIKPQGTIIVRMYDKNNNEAKVLKEIKISAKI